ncbi:MAG: hypothetical protein JWM34_1144 [Ilumatobacteraceae bacterium]|nr:hypothetical protein [Ilumatobacteraceae bacterium]
MAEPKRFTVEHSLVAQAASCAGAGSPLYAALLDGVLADYRAGGVSSTLLDGVTDQPVHDALPLRYLATAHRLALSGRAPHLAEHYPSCGGHWEGDPSVVTAFVETAGSNHDAFVAGLRRNVQTNEVGRAAVLASGFAWIAGRFGLPLDQLEVGTSAGILSRWDRFGFDTGRSSCGDHASALQFGPSWWIEGDAHLGTDPTVVRRRASDISPIDVTTDDGRTTMLSFVWPDQMVRVERLRTAMQVAAEVELPIDRADAGQWLAEQLDQGLAADRATVVFHSIVWQYLPSTTREALRAALSAAGATATERNPLCWLRMEPATADHADLRVTIWPGGDTTHLADVGYHGADIRWHTSA